MIRATTQPTEDEILRSRYRTFSPSPGGASMRQVSVRRGIDLRGSFDHFGGLLRALQGRMPFADAL
ncbi:MAG TPA: hypothetical protein DIT48_08315 [Actinobacteria bacterium]|nr:hypothetical protein [Actinomycetota bacterium]